MSLQARSVPVPVQLQAQLVQRVPHSARYPERALVRPLPAQTAMAQLMLAALEPQAQAQAQAQALRPARQVQLQALQELPWGAALGLRAQALRSVLCLAFRCRCRD